jgi:hypothetical protein
MPGVRLTSLPRMADFALWAAACETALWAASTFARAYAANRRAGIESIVDADPVAACVREIMAERGSWMGIAADLHGPAPIAAVMEFRDTVPTGPKIHARSPAVCAGRRPSCGPPASRWPSVVKAAPEPGSSGYTVSRASSSSANRGAAGNADNQDNGHKPDAEYRRPRQRQSTWSGSKPSSARTGTGA